MTEGSDQSDVPARLPPQIGGWLVFPGLGLGLNAFGMGYVLSTTQLPLLFDGTLTVLLDADDPRYRPRLAAVVLFETCASFLLLIGMLHALWLFVNRSVRTRPHFIVIMVAFVFIQWIALTLTPPDTSTTQAESLAQTTYVVRTTISAGIWITYFNVSKRVRRTFVATP